MTWFDRLVRGRRPRVRASTVDVAARVTEGIVDSTNLLRSRLEEEGVARGIPERFSSEDCLLECTLFEWFLYDAVIELEFGRHAGAVRDAVAGRVLIDLFRSGLGPGDLADFDGRRSVRFDEYRLVAAAGESLQALGSLACLRILGRTNVSERGTMFLARRARARIAALRGLGKAVSVVEANRALVDQP